MRRFEYLYTLLRYFEHPLYQRVHHELRKLTKHTRGGCMILDVGGRKSNYTIGLPAKVWITDIPRETELQNKLDLGANETMINTIMERRSNIEKYVIDDMTSTKLSADLANIVVAVEVLEHVAEDDSFVANVKQVLKADGWFVMTTPNGDEIPVPYPDHKRHYKRDELKNLLNRHFQHVEVHYCVIGNVLFKLGLFRWSARNPFRTLLSMSANFLNYWIERVSSNGLTSDHRQHLFAICYDKSKR